MRLVFGSKTFRDHVAAMLVYTVTYLFIYLFIYLITFTTTEKQAVMGVAQQCEAPN